MSSGHSRRSIFSKSSTVRPRSTTDGRDGLLATEGHQLTHDGRGVIRALLDFAHPLLDALGCVDRVEVHDQELRVSGDRRQHVVEVVRHAARESAERLELTRLPQVFFTLAQRLGARRDSPL